MYNGYETEELVADHIKALLRELAQCEQVGNGERADMVRTELRKFGHKAEKPSARAEKRPVGRPPKSETR